jgi:2-keto-3-deoxy-L-rhamnonate aldolase RhmA
MVLVTGALSGASAQAPKLYNTAKAKLMSGKPVVGATIYLQDPEVYCAMANAGYDFLWIEMQHAPTTFESVARMIGHCKNAPATPFIHVQDATEGDIQKATDIGALGVIVPTVDTAEKARNAVKWAKYPPLGRRSQGGGQYRSMWPSNYRETANENILVVAMIETPEGVAAAGQIAAVPGIDVVFAASTDLGNFSGFKQDSPEYNKLVESIRQATQKAGKKLGGPQRWFDRPGFVFLQAPAELLIMQEGAAVNLKSSAKP